MSESASTQAELTSSDAASPGPRRAQSARLCYRDASTKRSQPFAKTQIYARGNCGELRWLISVDKKVIK